MILGQIMNQISSKDEKKKVDRSEKIDEEKISLSHIKEKIR